MNHHDHHCGLSPARRSLGVLLAIASAILLLAPPAGLGQTETPRVLTYEEALSLALAQNNELVAARFEVGKADERVSEAVGTALPRLDLSASYNYALKKPVFFLPGDFFGKPGTVQPVEIGSTHAFYMGLTASQILFNNAVFAGLGAAKIYSKGAREIYRAKELEVISNTRKAFLGVLVAREAVSVMQQTVKNAEENDRNIRLLVSQGIVSEYDQLRSEVAVANLRPELINAENGYKLALNNLRTAIGLRYEQPIEVTGSLEYAEVPDSLIRAAQLLVLQQNPALAGLKYKAEVDDAIISAQRSEYLPTLSAFGNYQYNAQRNEFRLASQDFIASSVVGLSLSLNIFNGLQTNARVEEAKLEYRKTQEQVAGAEKNLHSSTEAVILNLTKARLRIEAQGKTAEQADRGYRIATTRYRSGNATLLEVNDAQLAQLRANVNRIQAIYEYLAAAVDLDQLLGIRPAFLPPTVLE